MSATRGRTRPIARRAGSGLLAWTAILAGLATGCARLGEDAGSRSRSGPARASVAALGSIGEPLAVPVASTSTPAPPPTTAPPAPTTTATTAPPVVVAVTTPLPPPTTEAAPPPNAGVPAPPTTAPATVATTTGQAVAAFAQRPSGGGPPAADWTFDPITQFGSPTTFLVTAQDGDWLRVVLPVRQNGSQGWIRRSQVDVSQVSLHIVVSLGQRRVTVWDGDRPIVDTDAVVGKPSTPTPTGQFYVTDIIRLPDPSGPYGPFVLATSARSDSFDFFNGGEPLVGLHGTNAPGLLGSAASNGCVRLPNDVATDLAWRVPLGTPVYIAS